MTEHLDLDALADVLAGEESSHLEGCAQCHAEVEALRAAMSPVATALASMPDPEPPPGLADRLSAALAQERLQQSRTSPATSRTEATVTPMTSRRNLMRWLPVGAGVAAAAALILGGVVLLQRGDTGHTASTSAGPTYRTNSSGTDYRKDGKLLASELPALLGGAALAEAVPGPAKQSSPLNGATVPQPAGAASIDALADLRTTRGLASCLASLSDAKDPGLPLALDYASFEGEPALVVVLPASKPDKVDVFVVGAACSVADAKVLFFTRLAKPS